MCHINIFLYIKACPIPSEEHLLFQLVVGERVRMRALPKELLLRHLDIAIAFLQLLQLATVIIALLACLGGRHCEVKGGCGGRNGKKMMISLRDSFPTSDWFPISI